jgi:hypothetical protein
MVLTETADHPMDIKRLDPDKVMQAMIESFGGDEKPLADVIRRLIASGNPRANSRRAQLHTHQSGSIGGAHAGAQLDNHPNASRSNGRE